MSRCRYCNNEAVVVKNKKKICKTHFNNFYINRLKKVIRKTPIKEKKVLLAISGGKDSVAIVHALAGLQEHYNFSFELIFIDLGIDSFSKESFTVSEKLANQLNLKIHYYSLSDYHKIKIDDLSKITNKICSYCGTMKRYLLNKFAYENDFDFIITGHNMDDEIIFLQQNILSGAVEYVKRYSSFYTETLREKKLIGKIKPQFFLSEQDNIDYCRINELDYIKIKCPYSEKSSHNVIGEGIRFLNGKMDYSYNFLQFFLKINKFLPDKEVEFKFCDKCGFPTTNYEKCKFCKTVEKVSDE